ncbi:hypothetical protein [Sphingobacterium multivorum]|uniref:hypothetical protein n=1 Tax=Sphingobacterium multivorum TaxID=28454 RepID=UPI0028AC04FE|nr:hypothetical protein [Sphingobacterium multivorum]
MPVSKKRKKVSKLNTKKKYKPYEVVKQPFVETSTATFSRLPFEEKMAIFKDIALKSGDEYEKAKNQLQAFLNEYDPLYLSSFCVLYFISSPEGIDQEAIDGYIDFPTFYVEVLQAIALQSPRTISKKVLLDEAQKFKETLEKVNKYQSYRYFNLAENAKEPEDISPVILRMDMMMNTLAIRNWAYEIQMIKVAYELAACIQKRFNEKLGFDPLTLLDILFGLTAYTNDKLNIHIGKFRTLLQAKTSEEAFEIHENNNPEIQQANKEQRNDIWERSGKNLKQLKWMLIAYGDLMLPSVFTFDLHEIKARVRSDLAIDLEKVKALIENLSLDFGDLKNTNTDYIFLNNPIHEKPFIRLGNNKYFSAITFMFPHLGVDILENFIRNDKHLFTYYCQQKGIYLETQVYKCFKEAFPQAKIFEGSLWKNPLDEKEYENDLIVLIENFAIIVESKSGTVTAPARRGAPNRLFETLKDLVVAPSEQSIRFQEYLKSNRRLHKFETKSGKTNQIDSTKIEYFVPLGITLSNLGSIGCNLKKLIDAKVIDHKIDQLAPSISLCDLQVIFEVLPTEAQKIHYLSRRREFEAHTNFHGDELDLFGFYLDTGFNIGETEYNSEYFLNLTLKSKELDPYFTGKHHGVKIAKPRISQTKYWTDLLNYLRKHSDRWLQTSFMLLNASYQNQIDFEKSVEKLKRMILKKSTPYRHNWAVLSCGPPRRRFSIIAYVYKGLSRSERNNIINQIAEQEQDSDNRGFVILGIDLDTPIYPYNIMGASTYSNLFDSL